MISFDKLREYAPTNSGVSYDAVMAFIAAVEAAETSPEAPAEAPAVEADPLPAIEEPVDTPVAPI